VAAATNEASKISNAIMLAAFAMTELVTAPPTAAAALAAATPPKSNKDFNSGVRSPKRKNSNDELNRPPSAAGSAAGSETGEGESSCDSLPQMQSLGCNIDDSGSDCIKRSRLGSVGSSDATSFSSISSDPVSSNNNNNRSSSTGSGTVGMGAWRKHGTNLSVSTGGSASDSPIPLAFNYNGGAASSSSAAGAAGLDANGDLITPVSGGLAPGFNKLDL
jgi:hypothetical protein